MAVRAWSAAALPSVTASPKSRTRSSTNSPTWLAHILARLWGQQQADGRADQSANDQTRHETPETGITTHIVCVVPPRGDIAVGPTILPARPSPVAPAAGRARPAGEEGRHGPGRDQRQLGTDHRARAGGTRRPRSGRCRARPARKLPSSGSDQGGNDQERRLAAPSAADGDEQGQVDGRQQHGPDGPRQPWSGRTVRPGRSVLRRGTRRRGTARRTGPAPGPRPVPRSRSPSDPARPG